MELQEVECHSSDNSSKIIPTGLDLSEQILYLLA